MKKLLSYLLILNTFIACSQSLKAKELEIANVFDPFGTIERKAEKKTTDTTVREVRNEN